LIFCKKHNPVAKNPHLKSFGNQVKPSLHPSYPPKIRRSRATMKNLSFLLPKISGILASLFLLLIHPLLFGQTFQTAIGYPVPTNERGVSGLIANNGNYIILGGNTQHPSGVFNPSGDMQLVRLNPLGNLLMPSKMIGQDVLETATWIEKASDCAGNPGYIIAGNEYNGGSHNMLLTLTDGAGNPVWVRRIGTPNLDEISACVKPDGAGNFILVGTKTNTSTGNSVIQAVKTDCAGNLLWEQDYRLGLPLTTTSVTAFATFQSACLNQPNEYFITGKIAAPAGGNEEVFILSVDATTGSVSWMKSYDIAPNADDVANCIQGNCSGATPASGSLWLSGYSLENTGGSDPRKVMAMQTDLSGNLIWANTYNIQNSDQELSTHFQFATGNKLVLTGKAEDPGVSDPPEIGQCMLMRISDDGNLLDWTRVYEMGFASQGNRVEPTAADEYFITGHTYEIIQPHVFDYNILAIKTDNAGKTEEDCHHSPETIIVPQQPLEVSVQPTQNTPQDFFNSSLITVLYDDKQTFCHNSTPFDPCDTLGLNANFSFTVSGNTATFTDLSTIGSGSIFSWSWSFGDAGTSNLQNPVHTYAGPGSYVVCLIVAGGNAGALCRDTICFDLIIEDIPVDPCDTLGLNANFSFSVSGNTATFTDLSTIGSGSIFSWSWSFGDAGTSNLQNPVHTYAGPGSYVVCLIVAGGSMGAVCLDTFCLDLIIEDIPVDPCDSVGLVANFSTSISGNTVNFTDISTIVSGTIFNWAWSFGDAGTSFVQNPTHTYSNTGVYTVCLVVYAYGTSSATMCVDTICKEVVIEELTDGCLCDSTFFMAVAAGFTATGSNPTSFTPVALDTCDKVLWIWGDSSPNSNSVANNTVFHTYAVGGTYFVCMVVTRTSIDGMTCLYEYCTSIQVPDPKLCNDNIVLNGDFTAGLLPGNLGGPGNVNNWTVWTNTPQVLLGDTCQEAGAIQGWGNQVVGESIQQPVAFTMGGIYEVTFCGKWLNTVQDSVRFRFRASTGLPISYLNCSGTCDEIYLSPVLTTNWATYTSGPWTATQNFNTLTISVWNNYNVNDGAFVSWARLDDVCIRRIGTSAVHDVERQMSAKVFPNPTEGDATLVFDLLNAQTCRYRLLDISGRVVLNREFEGGAGENQVRIPMDGLAQGIYLLDFYTEQGRTQMRVVLME
jgi:PKD repeat protein